MSKYNNIRYCVLKDLQQISKAVVIYIYIYIDVSSLRARMENKISCLIRMVIALLGISGHTVYMVCDRLGCEIKQLMTIHYIISIYNELGVHMAYICSREQRSISTYISERGGKYIFHYIKKKNKEIQREKSMLIIMLRSHDFSLIKPDTS